MAPGFFGSLVGLLLAWVVRDQALAQAGAWLVVAGASILSVPSAEGSLGQADSRHIVIDEVAGMLTALTCVGWTAGRALAALAIFRWADVTKPAGLRRLERLPSPWGVLLDDVAAGVLANLLLQIWVRLLA